MPFTKTVEEGRFTLDIENILNVPRTFETLSRYATKLDGDNADSLFSFAYISSL
jgi:hypothetical protein